MSKTVNTILFTFLVIQLSIGQEQAGSKTPVFESIFVYTDREVYLPGETIWFSADYLINDQKPDVELSKVLYVELLNFEGLRVARDKFEIFQNKAEGKLEIPEGLQSNYYLLTVYTQYQRNQEPGDLYSQVITIINPTIPLTKFKTDEPRTMKHERLVSAENGRGENEYAVQINPQLIYNLNNAQIVDTAGNQFAEIRLFPNGLGHFHLFPRDSIKYSVRINYLNGDTTSTPINFQQPKDLVSAKIRSDYLHVTVNLPENDLNSNYSLFAYSQSNQPVSETEIEGKEKKTNLNIPLQKFQPGLIYVLLKTDSNKLIGLNTVFVFPEEPVVVKMATSKKSYKPREKVELTIPPVLKNDREVIPLSLTVVKSGTQANSKSLPVYLIENPVLLSAYFRAHPVVDKSIRKQVEILTAIYKQKPSPGFIKSLTENTVQTKWIAETRGSGLCGIVRDRNTKKPLPDIEVLMSILGKYPQLKIFTTDEKGEFIFALDHIQNMTNIYITLKTKGADEMEVMVMESFSGNLPDLNPVSLNVDTAMRFFIEEMYVNAQVMSLHGEEDTVTSPTNKAIRFSEPGVSIFPKDYVAMPSLESVFNELVPFVKVRKKGQNYWLEVLDEKTNIGYGEPLILVDNLPVFDVNQILTIHPSVVEKIEVINSTYLYGDHVVEGIVLITTNTNNFGNIKLPESFTSLEFIAPALHGKSIFADFNKPENKLSRKSDFRNTLYFDNNLEVGSEKIQVTFFTSDHTADYDVILRGITKNGEQIFGKTSFKVKK